MWMSFLSLAGWWLACAVGPGWLLLRSFRWPAREKLAASVGLSFLLVYLASFVIYLSYAPGRTDLVSRTYFIVTMLCAAATLYVSPDFFRVFRARSMRRDLAGFLFFGIWSYTLLSLVRHYSGGLAMWDWWEHYQRALFFIEHWQLHFRFSNVYPIPSRPPLMNLLAADFLAQAGSSYDRFQILCVALNLSIYFPLLVMARRWSAPRRLPVPLLVGFMAINPLLMWNFLWTWTKVFAAFYVVLGVLFYLQAIRRDDPWRLALASAFLGAAMLVHFSAGPYLVFVAGHFLYWLCRYSRAPWRDFAVYALSGTFVLATWFTWAVKTYGAHEAFLSNTTSQAIEKEAHRPDEPAPDTNAAEPGPSAAQSKAQPLQAILTAEATKIAYNIYYSFVPHPLGVADSMLRDRFLDQCRAGYVRDWYLTTTGPTFTFGMGAVGGLLFIWLAGQSLRGRPWNRECRFWLSFVPVTALLGIATHPTVEVLGVAQICGQSLIYLGLAFLAARFLDLPMWARLLGLLCWVIDFAFGIFLQVSLENQDFAIPLNNPNAAVRTIAEAWLPGGGQENWWGMQCWGFKKSHYTQFWADHFAGHARLLQLLVLIMFILLLTRALHAVLWSREARDADMDKRRCSDRALSAPSP
jgi:hypothetical protein